ncbi:MAG: hypothetical protein CSA07_00355 [Bacteroidia bacterium]|nr:MAG: hypothetical protein CSA07_00355 [Bacteroidia bacterium]
MVIAAVGIDAILALLLTVVPHYLLWINLVLVNLVLLFTIWFRSTKMFYFQSDEHSLRYRTSYRSLPRRIAWEEVQAIRIGPAYIRIFLKERKSRRVSLGWLHYDTLIELKNNIAREAKARRVSCKIVPIA